MLNCINTKSWDDPCLRYLALDFNTNFDAANETIRATGTEELIGQLQRLLEAVPSYHSTFVDVAAEVNERAGKGTVWVLRTLSGFPDGLRRESVSAMDWERLQGSWYLVRHRGIRGAPGSDFGEDADGLLTNNETVLNSES
ncbi:uncharacterized protein LTR77_006463 [Saxophila tyrrhenica]|uniref:SnoaL-like domain-containing protein n=1 Tax=Saxophila tyrrhenica TaxID=1690608 RepID=A0AAV9P7Y5_9PEZI|nr:hypothetical protein LTR77_006463 [Saxophila tyrrhenica]